jgi:SPP1 gp7 family putative phage head morphogenesis protein
MDLAAAACDVGHPQHGEAGGFVERTSRRDTTVRDPHFSDPTDYESRTDWQKTLWRSRIDDEAKRYIKQLENTITDNWSVTFDGLWGTVEAALDRRLPLTDEVLAEYVRDSAKKQLRNLDLRVWESAFNGLYVRGKQQAYGVTGFDRDRGGRTAQVVVDTPEEHAVLRNLRETALQQVKSVTDRELRRKILERLTDPGATSENPTKMANEIIREERRRLEKSVEDRDKLKEQIKGLYDDQLWQIQRITRTETVNAYWIAQLTGYRDQGIEQIKFNSHTYDQKTCAICLALDGTAHDIDAILRQGGRYPLSTMTHPQCRCVGEGAEVCTFDRGWVPIAEVRPGDFVLDVRHDWCKVTQKAVFHKRHDVTAETPVVRVLGVALTEDHLVWTENGWKEAGEVEGGDLLVRGVRGDLPEPAEARSPRAPATTVPKVVRAVSRAAAIGEAGAAVEAGDHLQAVRSAHVDHRAAASSSRAWDVAIFVPSEVSWRADEIEGYAGPFGRDDAANGWCDTPSDFCCSGENEGDEIAPWNRKPEGIGPGNPSEGVGRFAPPIQKRSSHEGDAASREGRAGTPVEGYEAGVRGAGRSAAVGHSVREALPRAEGYGQVGEGSDRHLGAAGEGRDRGRWVPLAQLSDLLSWAAAEDEGQARYGDGAPSRLDDATDLGARHSGRPGRDFVAGVPAVVEADPSPPEVFYDLGTTSHHFLVRAPGGEPFGVHNCWPSPQIAHVTIDSMEALYRDEPELFAPGQTVFDEREIGLEDVVKDHQTIEGTRVENLPVEHRDDVKEALGVIHETPYQQLQPQKLRFVVDVGEEEAFQKEVPLPQPILGQVTAWTSPARETLLSQWAAQDGQTVSSTILREWAGRIFDADQKVRDRMESFYGRAPEDVRPDDLQARTIAILTETFVPFTMMRRQLIGDAPSVALEKRLREAPDQKAREALERAGISPKDVDTIVKWRRDRPAWGLDGRYIQQDEQVGSAQNVFVNRVAERGAREMFSESCCAYVSDPWGLADRDPDLYDWLREHVFGHQEFRD